MLEGSVRKRIHEIARDYQVLSFDEHNPRCADCEWATEDHQADEVVH